MGAKDLFTGLQDCPFLFLKTARRNYVSSMISGHLLSSDERLRRTSTTKGMNNLKSRGFFSDFSARVPAPARPISPNVAHFALTFPPRNQVEEALDEAFVTVDETIVSVKHLDESPR
jgi:hypothetical protein